MFGQTDWVEGHGPDREIGVPVIWFAIRTRVIVTHRVRLWVVAVMACFGVVPAVPAD
jgi:hypothetical protein